MLEGIVDACNVLRVVVVVVLVVGRQSGLVLVLGMMMMMMMGVQMLLLWIAVIVRRWICGGIHAGATILNGARLMVCGWRRRWRCPELGFTFVRDRWSGRTSSLGLGADRSDAMVSIGDEHFMRRRRRCASVAMHSEGFSVRRALHISRLWSTDEMRIHLLDDHHFDVVVFFSGESVAYIYPLCGTHFFL